MNNMSFLCHPIGKILLEKKHLFLLALFAPSLLGCGTFDVKAHLMRPTEATATAQAAFTPTPKPNLGKLAYVQGGDIWVQALPNGELRRLTTDGRNYAPRWSPSGRWLAFRKGDYQVWIVHADGGGAYPLNGGAAVSAFAWAPAQDRLAYVAAGSELRVATANGDQPVTLVSPSPDVEIGRIAWSPDGAWLAYERRELEAGRPPTMGLWKVSAEGGEPVRLYPNAQADMGDLILHGWTGDGRFLLVQSDMNSASLLADGAPLYALPADGGPLVNLAEAVLAYTDFIAPRPGTDEVAVVVGGGREAWQNKRLSLVRASTGEGRLLTPPDQAISAPAWSPDGRHIVYVAMPAAEGLAGGEPARQALLGRHLWVINVEDGQSQPLTDDPAYRDEHPLWSSDGRHILFARLDDQNRASVWLISADGGEPQQVASELTPAPEWFGYYGHLNWDDLLDWWPNTRHVARVPAPTPPGSPSGPSPSTLRIAETSATPAASPSAASTQSPQPFSPVVSGTISVPTAVRSYHAVLEQFSHARNGDARWRVERWYQAPDRFRQEVDKLEGPPSAAGDRTFVRNGDTVWLFIPDENRVVISRPADPSFGRPETVPDGALYAGFEEHPLGDKMIAGRAARGLRLVPKDPEAAHEVYIWYDRETGVVLVREEHAPDGTLEQAVRTLEVQFNVDLPANLFTFEPPAGVRVEDQR
jgi:Tol biopolymer transport system component/outer membrane lipoprotein-sorting protein